jgi:pyruvate/2-oxoglutarate dehydrogenase complex dihydrolipoamide dehydrogenase (E3) component
LSLGDGAAHSYHDSTRLSTGVSKRAGPRLSKVGFAVGLRLRVELRLRIGQGSEAILTIMRPYELAVIGSGSGGREAALLRARKGLRTVVIERDRIGGSRFHRGCYAVGSLQACSRQFRDSWKSGRFGPTLVKAIINPQSKTLLGCLVIGDHAAVIANVAAIAIHSKMPIEELREIPMAQPSAADALINTLRAID